MTLRRGTTPQWHKSSYSGSSGSNCVEAAALPATVLVRDTKQGGTGPVLRVQPVAWAAFIDGARAGEFNL